MKARKPSRARAEIIELAKAMRDSGTLDEITHARITARQSKADATTP